MTIDTEMQSWRHIILETEEKYLGLQNRKQERRVDLYGKVESNRLKKTYTFKMDQRRIGGNSQLKATGEYREKNNSQSD